MFRILLAGLVASALLLGTAALADDSTAMLGAGGIVLTKNADLTMATEDLYLSPTAVKVHYTFTNNSGSDIDTIVAFPLPDIDNAEHAEWALGTTKDVTPNFVGFELAIDGKKVPATAEEHAIYKGRDFTAAIQAAGLPINIMIGDGYDKLQKLSETNYAALIKDDLIDGARVGDTVHAKWIATTKFWWHMRFPAGKTVSVDHSYQPVTGQTFFGAFSLESDEIGDYQKSYCLDASTTATIKAHLAAIANQSNPQLDQYTTQFVILTARNWNGPIGRFHLTVDKLKPDNILSVCWAGDLKTTGPTRFESTLIGFTPKKDIQILVLENPALQQK